VERVYTLYGKGTRKMGVHPFLIPQPIKYIGKSSKLCISKWHQLTALCALTHPIPQILSSQMQAFTPTSVPLLRFNRHPCINRRSAARSPSFRIRAQLNETSTVPGGGISLPSGAFDQYDGRDYAMFEQLAESPHVRMVPLWQKLFSDQITPVLAYRCLVGETDINVPSFLLESVHTGERIGRYSLVGARPHVEIVAYGTDVTVTTHGDDPNVERVNVDDPWELARSISEKLIPAVPESIPGGEGLFSGGWVGYGGYDTMRYKEPDKLPFSHAPPADPSLPDLHLGLYRDVIVFDHVAKLVYIVHWADLEEFGASESGVKQAHSAGLERLNTLAKIITSANPLSPLVPGTVSINTDAATETRNQSNMTREQFFSSLDRIKHHIAVGDVFQLVFSQRFERWSRAHPFSVYRSLRIINPSPYMIYMQSKDSVLVASSPEILARVEGGKLTNRPLAGTRRRGRTKEEDEALEEELLKDGKDVSEHLMLVDLGRNDVGIVAEYGSVKAEQLMKVERYSHVMHISSTVTGQLRSEYTSWDALRASLPAGTISGAPKIRAMEIIDELEPTKRGPYGGAIGYVSLLDHMNMALALRTMVVPVARSRQDSEGRKEWQYMLQAGAGIVHESDHEAEYTETVNKAMAMSRAIDLAETAF